jgi:hypothetical protein
MSGKDSSYAESTDESNEVELETLPVSVVPIPPPDGGYGWVCVGACFTINCFTWGVVAVKFQHLPFPMCSTNK